MPTDLLEASGAHAFTHAALLASGLVAGVGFVDLPATDWTTGGGLHPNNGDEGGVIIRMALVNIKEGNLAREFSAVGYAKYKVVVDGVEIECYRYAAYDAKASSRSIAGVARMALSDLRGSLGGDYDQAMPDGKYSPYTVAQREAMKGFTPEDEDAESRVLDLFLVAGQSNAGGHTYCSSDFIAAHPELAEGPVGVMYAGNAVSQKSQTNYDSIAMQNLQRVQRVVLGLGKYDGVNTYIGPEVGMASMLGEVYDGEERSAAIVKYAFGGTTLTHATSALTGMDALYGNWSSPSYLARMAADNSTVADEGRGKLYLNFISHVASEVAYYRAMGYTVNIKAVYWMQGESDRNIAGVLEAGHINNYANALADLIHDMRVDLGTLMACDLLELPVFVGEISRTFGNTRTDAQDAFIAMQNDVADAMANVWVVDNSEYAVGCSDSDSAHWTPDDALAIGRTVGYDMLTKALGYANITNPLITNPIVEVVGPNGESLGSYNNIAYAVNKAAAGCTVKLLANVALYAPLNLANGNAVVLDGNGKTLQNTFAGYSLKLISCTAFELKGITLAAQKGGVWINGAGSGVTVNGGSFSTATGTLRGDAPLYLAAAPNSTLTVNGGSFTATNLGAALFLHNNAAGSSVSITGGTFTAGANAEHTIVNDKISMAIHGARVNESDKGYVSGTGKDTYTNVAHTVADGAMYGAYANLATALNYAPAGGVVYLTTDVSLSGGIVINNPNAFTFDGNGKTLTNSYAGNCFEVYSNVTVKDLIYNTTNTTDSRSFYMQPGGKLTIESGTYTSTRWVVVLNQAATVNIKDGTFNTLATGNNNRAPVFVNAAADVKVTLTISGGSFNGNDQTPAFKIGGNVNTGSVVINGGTFTPGAASGYAIHNTGSITMTISGASLKKGVTDYIGGKYTGSYTKLN